MLINRSIADFAKAVAAPKPIMPAGGCVTALSGLMGICLMEMVTSLSAGWSMEDEHKKNKMQEDLLHVHHRMMGYIDKDAEAYNKLIAAFRLKGKTDEEKQYRMREIQTALVEAIEIPLQIGDACLTAMELGSQLFGKVKPNVIGDLKVGMLIAKASIDGALSTAKLNLSQLNNKELFEKIVSRMDEQQGRLDRVMVD